MKVKKLLLMLLCILSGAMAQAMDGGALSVRASNAFCQILLSNPSQKERERVINQLTQDALDSGDINRMWLVYRDWKLFNRTVDQIYQDMLKTKNPLSPPDAESRDIIASLVTTERMVIKRATGLLEQHIMQMWPREGNLEEKKDDMPRHVSFGYSVFVRELDDEACGDVTREGPDDENESA